MLDPAEVINAAPGQAAFTGTPFSARTTSFNPGVYRFCAWDIYHVVEVFTTVLDELRTLREAAVVIDMSPLSKHDISGPDAERFVDYVLTRDATRIETGQIKWTAWCDHDGKVISDGMVFRLGEDHFRITGDPSGNWLEKNSEGFDVELADITHERGILSLQGPRSRDVLEAVLGGQDADISFSRVRIATIGGVEVEVARQGFTGEHGYELCVARDDAVALWDAVMAAGQAHGIKPCGYAAADIARLEAGLVIPGPDYTNGGLAENPGAHLDVDTANTVSPFASRMARAVDMDKGDFIGKEALLEEAQNGTKQDMVGLKIDWQAVADLYIRQDIPPRVGATPIWVPLPVSKDGAPIGRATSAAYSPAAGGMAAFGFLDKEYCVPGTEVSVEFDVEEVSGPVNAEVVDLPFLTLKRAN